MKLENQREQVKSWTQTLHWGIFILAAKVVGSRRPFLPNLWGQILMHTSDPPWTRFILGFFVSYSCLCSGSHCGAGILAQIQVCREQIYRIHATGISFIFYAAKIQDVLRQPTKQMSLWRFKYQWYCRKGILPILQINKTESHRGKENTPDWIRSHKSLDSEF